MTAALPNRRAVGAIAGSPASGIGTVQKKLESTRMMRSYSSGSDARGRPDHGSRVCRPCSEAVVVDDDRVGVAEAAVVRRARGHLVTALGETRQPVVRSLALDVDRRCLATGPRVEAGGRTVQRPPSGMNGRSGRLRVVEQAGGELQEDLRLGIAAHGAEDAAQRTVT